MTMLTGPELLATVKSMKGQSKTAITRACNYVKDLPNGKERVCFAAFYEALLEAKGTTIGAPSAGPGRSLGWTTKVHYNGNLLVGKAYLRETEFKPGDQVAITLGKDTITLRKLSEPIAAPD
jgi:hypothetical protein